MKNLRDWSILLLWCHLVTHLITEVISNNLLNLQLIFRLPFISSEIFNCEINSILDKFFDAPEPKKQEAQDHEESGSEEEKQVNFDQDFAKILLFRPSQALIFMNIIGGGRRA